MQYNFQICIYVCSCGAAAAVSKEFIIILRLFCFPNYLINSVVLIAMFTICFVEALSCSVCLFEEGDISLNNSCPAPALAQRLNDGVCEILY